MLGSKLLYSNERNKDRIKLFTSKAFLSILQSDQILSSCLIRKLAKAIATTNVIAKEINYLRVVSIPYNDLDMYAVIFSK